MRYRLTCLTPLLVGDGRKLSPIDYMVWKDHVNVLDQWRIFRRIFRLLAKGPPSAILRMEHPMSKSLIALLLVPLGLIPGQGLKPIALPTPQTSGGKPLMQVLKERKSVRDFGPEQISRQMLSNLLWAAWGVNREDGRRTAPSASNRQEIDVYAIVAGEPTSTMPRGTR